jgi:thymidine kinase
MSLEIIIGPMFSGKTTYALSWIGRQRAIHKKVLVIKPDIDVRYSNNDVSEHTPCIIWDSSELLNPFNLEIRNADCVVIDEAQFLKGLSDFVKYTVHVNKKNVLIVGLDGDCRQRKFGDILDCIPLATAVTKLHALCSHCNDGTLAPFCQKKQPSNNQSQVDIGGADKYEAVCLKHLSDIQ